MSEDVKNLCVLGSTGSIGKTVLRIVRAHPDRFKPLVLAARSSGDILLEQAKEFKPKACVLTDQDAVIKYCGEFNALGIELLAEEDCLRFVVGFDKVDSVVCAMSGTAGLIPMESAIQAGKEILFANKEALVVGGEYIMRQVRESGARFLPIDSEHSAVYQCLLAGRRDEVSSITLTASGGPFLHSSPEQMMSAAKEQVMAHPTWEMGPEVTVNSATMMNKALEVIEAHFLFGLPPEKIRVVIHPQSIVHGMVEFVDGSVMAQLSPPDMAVAVQYAMTAPDRLSGVVEPLDLAAISKLEFQQPDLKRFPALKYAYDALEGEWWEPVALNAINETLVRAFLADEISFGELLRLIPDCFQRRNEITGEWLPSAKEPECLDEILQADAAFRNYTLSSVSGRG